MFPVRFFRLWGFGLRTNLVPPIPQNASVIVIYRKCPIYHPGAYFDLGGVELKQYELTVCEIPQKKTEKHTHNIHVYMGLSKNRGTPKMDVIMENPIQMEDLGVPLFLETPTCR